MGVVFGSLTPPEQLSAGSRLAESLGFRELWFSEDCFFTGAMSGMTQMLASTHRIPVGLGLASTQTRHPALLAMELAGLARMHPGRVRATLGLGNAHWLRQMGTFPDRPLSALVNDFDAVGSLLAGESVTRAGGPGHTFDDITLSFPPAVSPPLLMGAVNERALRAAGARADGVLLSVLAGPAYVQWAREQVAAGAAAVGRAVPPITVFVLASVDDDPDRARDAVADAVSDAGRDHASGSRAGVRRCRETRGRRRQAPLAAGSRSRRRGPVDVPERRARGAAAPGGEPGAARTRLIVVPKDSRSAPEVEASMPPAS